MNITVMDWSAIKILFQISKKSSNMLSIIYFEKTIFGYIHQLVDFAFPNNKVQPYEL
jgi:hypothetical protein